MTTMKCDVTLNDLVDYLILHSPERDVTSGEVVHEHLERCCTACILRLSELRMALDGSWPVLDISLN